MIVISTEAAHSFIVSSAVERPPHFVFAVACSFVCHPAGICFFSRRPSSLLAHEGRHFD
jgi:hypothetical protein